MLARFPGWLTYRDLENLPNLWCLFMAGGLHTSYRILNPKGGHHLNSRKGIYSIPFTQNAERERERERAREREREGGREGERERGRELGGREGRREGGVGKEGSP